MLNKKIYLDKMILSAKTGSRESFEEIRSLFSSLCERIYDSSCDLYPILKSNKFHAYHNYYIAFWNAINKYNFMKGDIFGSILIEEIVKATLLAAGVPFKKEETKRIMTGLRRDANNRDRLLAIRLLRMVTPKQRQGLSRYIYSGLSVDKAASYYKMSKRILERRILLSYKRIKRSITAVDEEKGIFKEHIYKIREVKEVK